MRDLSDRNAEIETRRAQAAYESRAAGLNWGDVASKHGYSSGEAARRAVNQHAPQARQPPWPVLAKPSDLLETRRARAAYESRLSGLKWKDVAARQGYTSISAVSWSVGNYAKEAGLPWPKRSAKSARNARIVAAVKAGATIKSLAEKYGLSKGRISQIAVQDGARARDFAKPPGVPVTCAHCGAVVRLPPSWAKKRRFCSRKCANLANFRTDRSRAAYKDRAEGMSWPDIAEKHGYASGISANATTQQHAKRFGLPWPVHTKPSGPHAAYESRVSGLKWKDVAARHGYASHASVIKAVKNYAKRFGLPWPEKSEKSARNARIVAAVKAGATIKSLAEKYGLDPSRVSRIAIRGGARTRDLAKSSPVPMTCAHCGSVVWLLPHLAKKRKFCSKKCGCEANFSRDRPIAAYKDRAAGLSWPEIAEKHGYSYGRSACTTVREHAKRVGLPWPP